MLFFKSWSWWFRLFFNLIFTKFDFCGLISKPPYNYTGSVFMLRTSARWLRDLICDMVASAENKHPSVAFTLEKQQITFYDVTTKRLLLLLFARSGVQRKVLPHRSQPGAPAPSGERHKRRRRALHNGMSAGRRGHGLRQREYDPLLKTLAIGARPGARRVILTTPLFFSCRSSRDRRTSTKPLFIVGVFKAISPGRFRLLPLQPCPIWSPTI